MASHIKLHGEKEARFEEIKEDLQDDLGYEPTNTEVVGMLMAGYEAGSDGRRGSLAASSQ